MEEKGLTENLWDFKRYKKSSFYFIIFFVAKVYIAGRVQQGCIT